MNQARYFLPHLLALSTSSPFWQGRDTGLEVYRSVIFENMPRAGIPPSFAAWSRVRGLHRHADQDRLHRRADQDLVGHAAPPKFPTLEFRVCDVCTKVDEVLCIAALLPGDRRQADQAAPRQPLVAPVSPPPDQREQVARRALRTRRQADRLRTPVRSCRCATWSSRCSSWSTTWSTSWAAAPRWSTCTPSLETDQRRPPAGDIRAHRQPGGGGGPADRGDPGGNLAPGLTPRLSLGSAPRAGPDADSAAPRRWTRVGPFVAQCRPRLVDSAR